jgi:hypothetical protein
MARKKRTELDKEISRAQKNARNKLYRIRKNGAINTDEFDPRVSPQELKAMNGSQKKAYLRKLKLFNKRSNKIVVQKGNGIAVPETLLKQYRQAELEVNAARILRREQIEESVKTAAQKDIEKIREVVNTETARKERAEKQGKPYKPLEKSVRAMRGMPVDWQRLDIDYMVTASAYYDPVFKRPVPGERNRFQDIVPIWMQEEFPSVESVEVQTRKAKEAKKRIKVARKRYPQYRAALVEKAMFSGYPELAEAIRALTYAQLDYLHYYTDFDAWGSFFSSGRAYERGEQAMFEEERDQTDQAAELMMREILKARRIRPGQSGISNVTYDMAYRGVMGREAAYDPDGVSVQRSVASVGPYSRTESTFGQHIFDYKAGKAGVAMSEHRLQSVYYEMLRQARGSL